uniref:Testis cDNA clone: QtsA-14213, similar to human hypothetical protein FLJ11838 (FLJ11838) n=1 Tax=Macaca fascicularis TaxID=9541 RepID=Q4R7W8_MACFA|nr:unnamed protein product [Macaca fascicularis]
MFLSLKCLNTRSSHLGAHLQITMKMVPKTAFLLWLKIGLPKHLLFSFKLETDPCPLYLIELGKALEVYQHQVVVANILEYDSPLCLL